MKDLHDVFEQKKIENEFQNRDSPREGVFAEYQSHLDELKLINQKLQSYNRQADQLEHRLRVIQKNYYDDMTIIDESYKGYHGEIFPWRSETEYTRIQYVFWDIQVKELNLTEPMIEDVAIRKEGNDKQIAILNNICRRILTLDDMAKTLVHRKRDIKSDLNNRWAIRPSALGSLN